MTEPSPFADLSILVADTSPYLAGLTATMLHSLGIGAVREVSDGRAAASQLTLHSFHIVILDSQLKEVDGIELTRRLRAGDFGRRNRAAAVIMTAANPDEQEIRRARDAGMTEFLRRPFAAKDIGLRIEASLKAPRPFIDGEDYAGPDRRRREKPAPAGDRRARGMAKGFKPVIVRND